MDVEVDEPRGDEAATGIEGRCRADRPRRRTDRHDPATAADDGPVRHEAIGEDERATVDDEITGGGSARSGHGGATSRQVGARMLFTTAPECIRSNASCQSSSDHTPPMIGRTSSRPDDKVGCHPAAGRRDPSPREYRDWFRDDLVRIATCAAELPGALPFYRTAARAGCLVTCGHSNATWGEMAAAFRAGVRHVDHFWCAMSSVASLRARCGTPMEAGMEQFVLASPEMGTEVIADGAHLGRDLLAFALAMLGPRRLCLVTDASRALDMPPGRYRFGHEEHGSWFTSDGTVGRAGGGLASSVVGMDHCVRTMRAATGADLPTVIRLASLTPAERAGIAADVGSLTPGTRADILVLSPRLAVRRTIVAGVPLPR